MRSPSRIWTTWWSLCCRCEVAQPQIVEQFVARRAGVAPANPHRFRHTFGCWSVRNGMDLIRLQRLMGHAKLDTLNIYLQFSTRDLVEAHREHGPACHLSQA